MSISETRPPAGSELYNASLIATAMVYGAGAVIFSGISYFGSESGGWLQVFQTFAAFLLIGTIFAMAAAFLLVAPLGAAFGLAVLRISPPSWWQGPLTGALVALTLEAGVIVTAGARMESDPGTIATLMIPVVLSMVAGGYVQHKVLNWPGLD